MKNCCRKCISQTNITCSSALKVAVITEPEWGKYTTILLILWWSHKHTIWCSTTEHSSSESKYAEMPDSSHQQEMVVVWPYLSFCLDIFWYEFSCVGVGFPEIFILINWFFLSSRVSWRRILRAHLDRASRIRFVPTEPELGCRKTHTVWIGCLGGWKAQSQQMEEKYLLGRPNLCFMFFSCASEWWKAGDDAVHLFLGPTPSMKYHISDILDYCHPSIRFPTMVQGSYQSTVCGGFGSGNIRFVLQACS